MKNNPAVNDEIRLNTRFHPPAIGNHIKKQHLFNFLTKRKDRKIFFVHGKSGQGKSTLVHSFLLETGSPFLWYRVHEDDKNPVLFLSHLIRGIDPGVIQENQQIDLQFFLTFIKSRIKDQFYIVLDDFHHIEKSTESHETINLLIQSLPENIHCIIISSRTDSFACTKYRFEKQLVEIRDRDLVFTLEETGELIENIYEMNLDQKIINQLHSVTQGWITGIIFFLEYLARMGADEQADFFSYFFSEKRLLSIDEYFQERVMNELPEELAGILSKLCLFNEVTPDLLSHFAARKGRDFFKECINRNLYVNLNHELSESLTFHPLFSAFLCQVFTKLPEDEQKKSHEIAADYYLSEDRYEEAITHLFKSNQRRRGEEIFFTYAETLLNRGQHDSIINLLKYFSEKELEGKPLLAYFDGLVKNLQNPFSSRKKLLNLLPYFRKNKDCIRESKIYTELLMNYLFYQESKESVAELNQRAKEFINTCGKDIAAEKREILKALIALGGWWENPEKDEPYKIALHAEETSYKFQNDEAFICSRLVLSKIYINRGEFNDALNLLLKTEKIFDKTSPDHPYLALIRFFLSDTYFYIGQIEKGIQKTELALEDSPKGFAFNRYLELNLIIHYLYTEDFEKAESFFEAKRPKELGENLYLQYFWVYLFQMMIAYRNRNKRRAAYYCRRLMETENEYLLKPDYPFSYLALGEINIFLENYEEAQQYLEVFIQGRSKEYYPYPFATACGMLGYIAHMLGNKKEAENYFSQMREILEANLYRNLDICNPEFLRKIADISGIRIFTTFTRLGAEKETAKHTGETRHYDLEFRTLGLFQIFVKGKEIHQSTLARQKRVIDLLKLLIVYRDHGISKEVVYDTFWPRYSYKSARDNLNTVVYRLRKILGEGSDFISTDMNIIKLKEGAYITDADMFISLIAKGRSALNKKEPSQAIGYFTEAAELYKGDFLEAGLYLDAIRDEREKLHNDYRHLLFELIKLCLSEEDFQAALTWANRLLSIDPLCEPAYRLLMIASVFTENRSELTRIFEKLELNLAEQYNITPDKKTVKLKENLLSGIEPDQEMWLSEVIL